MLVVSDHMFGNKFQQQYLYLCELLEHVLLVRLFLGHIFDDQLCSIFAHPGSYFSAAKNILGLQ